MHSVATAAAGYFMSRRLAQQRRKTKKHHKRAIVINPIHFLGGKQVTINVSGAKFQVNETYLTQHPTTLLGSNEKDYFWDEEENEYFFDRDPHIFRMIHRYYKTGVLHFSEEDCYASFKDELDFFGIAVEEVANCCSEDYYRQQVKKSVKEPEMDEISNPETIREKLWEFCEDPGSTMAAKIFYYISCVIIFVSVTLNTVETINCEGTRKCGDVHEDIFFILDSICVVFFTLEYLIRLYAAPQRCKHAKSPMSVIDVAAILPYYVDLLLSVVSSADNNVGAMNLLVTLRTLRIFRIFKLARHSKRLRELSTAISKSTSELGFIVFMYTIVIVLFASILYYAERVDKNTPFFNIPEAMWYTVVTTTTLG